MAKTRETLDTWAAEFVRSLKPHTPEELRKGREAFERAWNNRPNLDIRPLTTTDLVRSTRDEH